MSSDTSNWQKTKNGKWKSQKLVRSTSGEEFGEDVERDTNLQEMRRNTESAVGTGEKSEGSVSLWNVLSRVAGARKSLGTSTKGMSSTNPKFQQQEAETSKNEVGKNTSDDSLQTDSTAASPSANLESQDVDNTGIKLSVIRKLQNLALKLAYAGEQQSSSKSGEWTTLQVWERLIQPLTASSGSSLRELISMYSSKSSEEQATNASFNPVVAHPLLRASEEDTGQCNVFVVHSWDDTFSNLVKCLEGYVEESGTGRNEDNTFFWLDIISLKNQRMTQLTTEGHSGRLCPLVVHKIIENCAEMVCIFDSWMLPKPLTEKWSLWELASARLTKVPCSLLLSREQRESLEESLIVDLATVKRTLFRINSANSSTRNVSDSQLIDEAVESLMEGGLSALDAAASECIAGAVIRHGLRHLDTLEKLDDQTGFDRAFLLQTISSIYQIQGDTNQAIAYGKSALECNRNVFGNKSAQVVSSSTSLALLHSQGNHKLSSMLLFNEALEVSKKVFGIEHPTTLTAKSNLATLYKSLGSADRALPLMEETLSGRRELFGNANPQTISAMNNLAAIYRIQLKYSDAQALYEEALQLRRDALGDEHPSTLISINNLGALFASVGSFKKAIQLYEEAYQGAIKLYGETHPRTKLFKENLMSCLQQQKRS